MPDIDRVNLDNNTTYDIISKTGRGLVRATMNDTTSTSTAFVVTADSGIESLYDGLTIVCKNTKVASASGCTIDLNGLGAKRIWVSQGNGYCTTHWGLNATYIFIYDATNERWELQQGRDTNDNDRYTISEYYKHAVAGTNGIKKYSLFAATGENSYTSFTTNDGTGAKTFDTTTEFDISKLYYFNTSSSITSGTKTASDNIIFCGINVDMRYSFTGVTTSSSTSSLVGDKPLYLVVTPTKGNYGKVTSPYYLQDIATDGVAGVVYVRVGWMRNCYYCDLEPENKAYIKWVNPDDNTDIRILDWIVGTQGSAIINSHGYAEGLNTLASGQLTSHAEGRATVASGSCSHAEGYKSEASSYMSHAEGNMTEATGQISHAEGNKTITNGNKSHAEGDTTTTYGAGSHAEGYRSTATGDQSHAEGYNGLANAPTSHVEGYECTTYADNSHAEGGHTSTGVNDSYQTFNSHAEGNNTLVTGNDSHAEGYCSIAGFGGFDITIDNYIFKGYWVSGSDYAKGDYVVSSSDHNFYECHTAITNSTTDPSEDENLDNWYLLREHGIIEYYTHAEGYATIAGGDSSHSEGKYTRVFGDVSHAEGLGTIAAGDYQHTGGKYNVADANSDYAEIIGNGTSDSNRSNARTLDWNGNESLAGSLKFMECDATSTEADYPVNMIEPGITWKEKGYGDKFEIKPHFRGFNDGNALLVNAATGEAGTDPDVETIAKLHAKTASVDLIGTVPVINLSTNTTDLTQADNNVSSNTYVGTYYRDANDRAIAKITGVAYTDGKTGLELYAKNFNTSGTDQGNNTLTLYTDKSGNKTVRVTAPQAWLDALTQTTPATVAPNIFNIIGRDGVTDNNIRWFFMNCGSSLNGFKLVIELPANNWCKYRIETIGTANFGLFHNELYVGTNGSAAIDQCGYRDLNGTFTTVSGCSAVPTTYLTWTADKSNRKLTSNMIPKYGMCMVMVQSSTAITNLVKITTVESN